MARLIILIGILLIIVGIVLQFAPGLLTWFGRLPGDIRYESGNTRVYIPITSMLLLSVGLTIAITVLRRLF